MQELNIPLEELLTIHSSKSMLSMKNNWEKLPPIRVFEIPENHVLRENFNVNYLIADGMKRYATAKEYKLTLQSIIVEKQDKFYKEDLEKTLNLARNYYGDYINW